MAKRFTLKKTERLKSRKSIDQVFNAGDRFFVHPFSIHYLLVPKSVENIFSLQVGVTVSKKYFKKAVERNRVKRITREAYRVQKEPLQQKLISINKSMKVFLVYANKELPVFAHIHQKLGLILQNLSQRIDEKNT